MILWVAVKMICDGARHVAPGDRAVLRLRTGDGRHHLRLSSGRPPAAIAVIRVSGPKAHDAGARSPGSLPEARTAAVRELRHPQTRRLLDEALVLRFDGPASSTGENVVEFQCHGGRAVVDAVLDALASIDGLAAG